MNTIVNYMADRLLCSYSVSIYIEIDKQIVQKREKKSWKFGTTLLDDIVNKKK